MSSAVVRHAADRSSPQPTILSGLGVVLGKETVRFKVDLEDEQQVMGKRWTKGKQAGQGRDGNQWVWLCDSGGGAGEISGDHQIMAWP